MPGKPVGTVWFALAHRTEDRLECQGHLIQFDGNRDAVRRQAVEYALNLLRGAAAAASRPDAAAVLRAAARRRSRAPRCIGAVAPLVAQLGAQAVPAENLHATLCFIGAVPEEELDAAARRRRRSVRGRPRRRCDFDALEYWEKPKILCATAAEDVVRRRVSSRRDSVKPRVAAGFTPDIKPFRAHLTLARKVRAARRAGASVAAARSSRRFACAANNSC